MRRIALAGFALLAMALGAGSVSAQSRLADQYVQGWKRICVYEMLMPVAGAREGERRPSLQIGRGEPCPRHYARPRRPSNPADRPRRPAGR